MAFSLARWGNDLHSGVRSYGFVAHRRRWFLLSGLLMLGCVAVLFFKGLNPGIEFRGGSEFQITGTSSISQDAALEVIGEVAPAEEPRVTTVGDDGLRIQFGEVAADEQRQISAGLAEAYGVAAEQVSATVIGPAWGADVTSKATKALLIFMVLVTVVMSLYFRAWRMAVAALVALVHDLLFTVGIYAAVGFEVTPASVIGFLTILGYSLYDTVVVFDKVKENTKDVLAQSRYTYGELANLAVNQTLVRSINTSVVALLPVGSILFIGAFLLGAGTLKDIALALFVGMAVGTFSSIFVATPLEVALRGREERIRQHTDKVLAARAAGGEAGGTGGVIVGALVPGAHRGTAAQPKRKRRP